MTTYVTYQEIQHLIPDIWETVLMYLQAQFIMPQSVLTFTDQSGFAKRDVSEYKEGAAPTVLAETEDLVPSAFTRELLAQLTPQEWGKMHLLTDRRIETDDVGVVADAAQTLGYDLGKAMETAMLADFQYLTGGSVGTAGSPLTWLNIFEARARLRAANVPAPYSVALHEYQWLDLATAANIAGSSLQPVLQVRNDIQAQYYIPGMNDMSFFVTSMDIIDGSDDALGAMYNRSALALDMRRGLRIEPERDASLRATELNATMVFAHGIWRPTWGVKIVSDATAPGTASSPTSTLVVTGFGDDLSTTSGQHETFTFTIVNTGTYVAQDILVTFTVDSDFTYVSDSENMGVFSSSAKTWTNFQLAPGQVAQIILVYSIAGAGAMVATVTSASPTPSPATPAATVTLTFS